SNIKMLDLTMADSQTERASKGSGPISVEELLAQARDNSSADKTAQTTNQELYLQFDQNRQLMTATEETQLLHFALEANSSLFLDCAPGQHPDQFAAASIAIQRCQQISLFLREKSVRSEVQLSPQLQVNQVRVSR
ncbi:MAG: hypothetical protein OIF55_17520, partial [Amphritea sp.]|nr:hypothetical protein [Amphritea sp.]